VKRGTFFEDGALDHVSSWVPLSSGSIDGGGPEKFTSVPSSSFQAFVIPSGEKRALYITLDSADIRYKNVTGSLKSILDVGETYLQNTDLTLEAGIGIGSYPIGPNTEFFSTRLFLGRLRYKTLESCPEIPEVITVPPIYDCMIQSNITTGLHSKTSANGIIFGTRALQDIDITNMMLSISDLAPNELRVRVYTKLGHYEGFEFEPSQWEKICDETYEKKEQYSSKYTPNT